MHQFTLLPAATKELQKKIMTTMVFLFAMIIFVLFVLPMLMSGDMNIDASSWLALVLLAGALAFSISIAVKKQKKMLSSYTLILTSESITREMLNTPSITILNTNIQEIVKGADGSFSIIGESKLNAIGVSAHIERREELELLLAAIRPLTIRKSVSWVARFQYPIIFLVIALLYATYYLQNKYASTASGVLFSVVVICSFVVTQKSKNIDKRTKKLSYLFLIPLLSVISSLILKWMDT